MEDEEFGDSTSEVDEKDVDDGFEMILMKHPCEEPSRMGKNKTEKSSPK